MDRSMPETNGMEIAIIGMSCRFPGGQTIGEFWENLKQGKESVSIFSDEELLEGGIDRETLQNPNYVKAGGAITGTEWFDIDLFQYSPREAEVMDPQLKILHECAWEALENSGYSSDNMNGLVGTYIGSSTNLYWMDTIYRHVQDFIKEAELLNGSQFFSTRLSHQLNLKGPSYTVQTACSSSLVAVHLACQALLSGDCDMALAGGVSLTLPEKRGYVYRDGMILSPDGHCRPFDASAKGTVNGNGAGLVVLKRLEDAVSDGDSIYAVVKGSAINNDGSDKVSFTAPSVEGQANAIKAAHYMAEVEPESITYVETHGTGTMLGDPIEIEALKLAFHTKKRRFCGIGSVKANIGHLDNAAGIAGLIKTAAALKHRMIPPSINFEKPNEKIDFENSPFYVNDKLTEWKNPEFPLRAGVSSFGMGGTNAHVVLEEAPEREASGGSRRYQLLAFSAQTEKSLDEQSKRLARYLKDHADVNLADVSYTLLNGRKRLNYRSMVAVSNIEEAKRELLKSNPVHRFGNDAPSKQLIFMFPGQGAQYINMGLELYREEKVFRKHVDQCFQILSEISQIDWKEVLYPSDPVVEERGEINQTSYTQPALFIIEYSLAKTLMEWGITPDGMIGHSIGEYVAACLSGVFPLKDALTLVLERAGLMQQLPQGRMVSVMASEHEVLPFMSAGLSIAAVNGPLSCVISGSHEEISRFEAKLAREGYSCKSLSTSHAFHSAMMDPILAAYREKLKEIEFCQPEIPYLSNVTGEWITASQATSPEYWVRHLRHTVRFYDGIQQLITNAENLFVEVGPGRILSSLIRQQIQEESSQVIVNTVRHFRESVDDDKFLLQSIGKLYIHNVKIDWASFFSNEIRHRIPLPAYPFDRKYYSVSKRYPSNDRTSAPPMEVTADSKRSLPVQDEKEQKVLEAFRDVTGVKQIHGNDDFFELGGNSLTAVNVVARLQKEFDISINDLFEHPRIDDLAQSISYKAEKHTTIDKEALTDYLTARRDGHRLEEGRLQEFEETRRRYEERNRRYKEADLSSQLTYENILLTGATGYLGVYLLRELFIHSAGNVHIIVRSGSQIEAENRVIEKIRDYFGQDFYDEYRERMFVYCGDLAKPDLGLDRTMYQYLSHTIQCIIHSAGDVSHYGNYAKSFAANVSATRNIIEFSLTGAKKDLNHISTLAVASGRVKKQKDILYTEYDHDLGQMIENHYPKTKLEAEKLVVEARKKGVNSNIFRVGNIVFDSKSGRFQENIEQNALYTMMKSYIEIGVVPEMEKDTDFTCVDDVSRVIICLFDKEELKNETHHIYNPDHVSLADLLTIPDLNLNVTKTSLEKFIDYIFDEKQMNRFASEIYHLQLHSVGDGQAVFGHAEQTVFHITAEKTNLLLKRMGFEWNKISSPLVRKMIEYGQQVEFFNKSVR
ncbi:type I polyketide synthase [Bacillus gobiensis]|uniref:Beta-ketoacyl synthase n=1 Tax=Bacillus gobiensis TaxID=1441095 RepID=A0A0M5JDU5_9BACI|nr:type I polyketide synthase [Bacillus gobiensis]ALC81181.1 beta-ketoacyl synthase [Bacillus gobiensis]